MSPALLGGLAGDAEPGADVGPGISLGSQTGHGVADRGIDAKVGADGWQKICGAMENDFRAGNFAGGVIKGIGAVSQQLARYFPKQGAGPNELPDTPVVM